MSASNKFFCKLRTGREYFNGLYEEWLVAYDMDIQSVKSATNVFSKNYRNQLLCENVAISNILGSESSNRER